MNKVIVFCFGVVCALSVCAQKPIEKDLLPSVAGVTFGQSKVDVLNALTIRFGEESIAPQGTDLCLVACPTIADSEFTVGIFKFEANDKGTMVLCHAMLIYNTNNVAKATRFFDDWQSKLTNKYGRGEDVSLKDTQRAMCFGKHCQGLYVGAIMLAMSKDKDYSITIDYLPVQFTQRYPKNEF